MKVGIHIDVRNPAGWRAPWDRVYGFNLELSQEAERLGLESVWLSEHHLFDDGHLPQPLTFAAAVAARTSSIRIGTAIMLAPLRVAGHLAEEAAVVDQLSSGRLELGLGAGYRAPEFDLYGVDIDQRFTDTTARVTELRAIWAEGVVTPPTAQSRLPIWLGYRGPKGARRAGLLNEGLLSLDPDLLPVYRAGLREGGHAENDARMAGPMNMFISDDPERDWAIVRKHHHHQWDSYRRMSGGENGATVRPFDGERARTLGLTPGLGNILVATPEDAATQIRERLAGCPVVRIFPWASPGALPEELALQHVRTLAEGLAPLLAGA
ncbi:MULTISPECIES: LLM class flavin-dependent oxidoreductase [Nocardiaceae]|uniref:Alkanesulfonate monooxygenase SsuD/methylene tetrahydromethanopterin reductase-like flavin-dependent oxidoreductase (Luciferase family) n=1 Tax=Rhodococcoides corynebacterioides TaxID=53972 RepID=A0ABS2KMR5_9NOCA|nr:MULTISPECIES: LLM class flavin-dependent oxidoreductase [Rhodococcus]MBM7413282.1 alkanesulfonate monooxygenase SsuD/methylene tetrahydromethanopterin reductase-like flavin-dependent oxidoreductase (luciferase family) [Rhodococcus corynebacterioides]MBP1115745.1 alkanesulfonate monooxygenase SsuD/methylene tetrahydromethanopterin reductase-like flavin-dependent oxidoreductase (luciferase family) [Rhodococcus sp. PvP016]